MQFSGDTARKLLEIFLFLNLLCKRLITLQHFELHICNELSVLEEEEKEEDTYASLQLFVPYV